MDLIRYSISKPVSVAVGVINIVLFGFIGRSKLTVQLTPDVETTQQITVKINWSGATPYEIEKDIIEKQEEVLSVFTSLFGMLPLVLATCSGCGTLPGAGRSCHVHPLYPFCGAVAAGLCHRF
jgi:hypothetical protein